MFLDVVKNCVLDELQERIRIITVTRVNNLGLIEPSVRHG